MEFTKENFDLLLAENATAKASIEKLNTDLESASKTIETLKSENEVITRINDELVVKFEDINVVKTPKDLATKVSEVKKVTGGAKEFEVEGVKYKFISPVFMYKKERIVAADVINDTAKLAELVAANVGTIQKV